MNNFLKNLNRIEFVITYDCTGKCKHCSEGSHSHTGIHIDKDVSSKIIFDVAKEYNIQSVMTFGGEPLLYSDSVCAIHLAAKTMNIPKRQLITNGFFSNDAEKVRMIVKNLKASGTNDILLSVDAFHQEHIPIEPVKLFAEEVQRAELPIRLSPAWLVGKSEKNKYNLKTAEILYEFIALGIKESDGNVVFPEGNALKYLKEYFIHQIPDNPYIENPTDVKSISIDPDGSIFGENIHNKNILQILENYQPDIF